MKHYLMILLLCVCFLTGCTVEADRIYTVCRITEDTTYVFSGSKEFFTYVEGKLSPCLDPTLQALPALRFTISQGEFLFDSVLPGHYKGTLKSVEHYVYKLTDGDSSRYHIKSVDWQDIELFVDYEDISIRILFNIRGDVRIYSSNSGKPPYIIED